MDSSRTIMNLKLLATRNESGNVRTFVFETGGLKWIPGQSQGYVLPTAGETEKENERWFTIASAPTEGEVHISTRISPSSFKQALNAMKTGDEIQAHGLEGDFTWQEEPSGPVVLVAGGIGVTPFRSILLQRQADGKRLNATLLYFSRNDDVPFQSEIEKLGDQHAEFELLVVVGQPITADTILTLAPQASRETVYLSGPEPMVESVGSALREHGVLIKQDWFPGYDEKNY